MKKNKNNSLIFIIIISLFFGLAGGIGGEFIARIYLFQDIYRIPLFGEINVPKNVYGKSNLIIESPKKVIVEQNTKVLETVNSASKNIVGFFKKKQKQKLKNNIATSSFKIEDYYNLDSPEGEGFVITSDGWIISGFIPQELLKIQATKASTTLIKLKKEFISKYAVINSDGQIFDLIDVNLDNKESVSFWRVDAKDLSVKEFEKVSEINNGQLVVATNFKGATWLTTISAKYSQNLPLVLSSDETYSEISLVQKLDNDFKEGFLFNTDGDLIALINFNKIIKPISSYFSCLSCLLDKEIISKPYLGLYYIDLANFADPLTLKKARHGALIYPNSKGISIIKNSPADIAGLKEGDIITAINTIEINDVNRLSDLISEFRPEEKLNFTIERNKKEIQLAVILGSDSKID